MSAGFKFAAASNSALAGIVPAEAVGAFGSLTMLKPVVIPPAEPAIMHLL